MKNHMVSLAAVAGLGLALAGTADATVVFSDDFNSENGGVANASTLNYASFDNWTVSNGTVDLIGNGYFDFLPGNGLYVDMDGSTRDAGKLTSTSINLAAGTYVLQFELAGNRRDGSSESVTVQVGLGTYVNQLISLAQNAPFTAYQYSFIVAAPTTVNLTFEGAGGDNIGMLLDDVSIRVPEPASLALFGVGLLGVGLARRRRAVATAA
jgi:hypothetical protein